MLPLRSLVVFTATALAALSTVSAAAVPKRDLPNTLPEVKGLPIKANPSALGNTDIGNTAQLIPTESDYLVKIGDGVVTSGTGLVTTADGLVGSVSSGKGKRDVPALPSSSLGEKLRAAQETLDGISKEMDAAIANKAALPGLDDFLKIIPTTITSLVSTLRTVFEDLVGEISMGKSSGLGGVRSPLDRILEPGKPFPTAAASTFVKTAIEIVTKAQNALGPDVPVSALTQTPVASAIDGFLAVILPNINDKELLLNVVCPVNSSFATLSKFCGGS